MSFNPKERRIFKFFDGTRMRGMDPLEADIALQSSDVDWEAHYLSVKLLADAMKTPGADQKQLLADAQKTADAMVKSARDIFHLRTYDIQEDGSEVGLTTMEVLELLGRFVAWRAALRNFTEAPPTSQPSTDGMEAVTGSGTDCGSTSPGKSAATACL